MEQKANLSFSLRDFRHRTIDFRALKKHPILLHSKRRVKIDERLREVFEDESVAKMCEQNEVTSSRLFASEEL